MKKKKIVIALGHDALGTTLPEYHICCRSSVRTIWRSAALMRL